ncbi:ferrous iron transport protein B [Diplocloster modestus]|uniref:Ferrous iron transport protein B n=1 Tax=Diplocloster modestus TaxID=2850322 RepID=A0ABS6KEC8_9FIRM|nr:ferrous iron transport protein B [Diplocloster modestus]MBU9728877.1 ferrous iron transport protein B [Diplocloster modestus]
MTSILNKTPVIALLGQPNSGKSTLFNGLTGLKQHVGNWPGKTVEKKEGYFSRGGMKYTVADLPGTYSLSANSEEEIITRDYIAGGRADAVCILADASQLERSLFMLADFAGIHTPAMLLLNMIDVAMEQGKEVDVARLQKSLGIPVVPFSATDTKHYDGFYQALEKVLQERPTLNTEGLRRQYMGLEGFSSICGEMPESGMGDYTPLWLAAKVIEGDAPVTKSVLELAGAGQKNVLEEQLKQIQNGALKTGECKFAWIDTLLDGAVRGKKQTASLGKFDRAATSRRWGKPLAVLIILLGLIAAFIPAAPFMMVGSLLPSVLSPLLTAGLTAIGSPQFIIGLVCDVGVNALYFAISMIGFVFGITLVFGFIEEIGYMARISYVFDNTMAKLGLQGKAIMPFLVSFGCTIGGAAGTRVIDNWGQRILTIALAWAVPCAATWAIVPMISSVFFGVWAPLVIVAIFAVAVLHMWITSKIFGRHLVKKEDRTGLIMELPPYHKPKWGSLLRYVFGRTKDVLIRALKVILLISLIFWLLSYTSDGNVENSVIYRIGTFIEPVTRFFGLGWQTFLAFISSAISKEAALGVLSSLYAGTGTIFSSTVGSTAQAANLGEILIANIAPAEALAFIFAVTFNIPCIVAVASTYQETHSAKWTGRIALYYVGMALLMAFVVYHIGVLLF